MKIWEALEKYDRVKRAGWDNEAYNRTAKTIGTVIAYAVKLTLDAAIIGFVGTTAVVLAIKLFW